MEKKEEPAAAEKKAAEAAAEKKAAEAKGRISLGSQTSRPLRRSIGRLAKGRPAVCDVGTQADIEKPDGQHLVPLSRAGALGSSLSLSHHPRPP